MSGGAGAEILASASATLAGEAVSTPASIWGGYSLDAMQLAACVDAAPAMLNRPQQHPERLAQQVSDRICNWYVPAFDNPYYGGIMTILRLAEFLLRTHGIRQRFLICGNGCADSILQKMTQAFPGLAGTEVHLLDSAEAVASIPASDYSIATLWTTAYVLLGVENTGLKFYLIQDFEPTFYPAGSSYAQAELTYRFGFYGIANSRSILQTYEQQYGGLAVELKPAIDPSVFHAKCESRDSRRRRLFYYARPGTPRNGFELAAAALRLVKASLGDNVDIVCAGSGWRTEEYGLTGVVRSLGLLPYHQTAELYRSCHAGLAMMMTRHPSYLPFELMACGAVVVANFNDANAWLLKDAENCLCSPATASALAHTINYALVRFEQLGSLRERASQLIEREHGSWDRNLAVVAEFVFSLGLHRQEPGGFGDRFLAIRDRSFTSTEVAHFRVSRLVPGQVTSINALVKAGPILNYEGLIVRQMPAGRGKDDGYFLVSAGKRRWIAQSDWLVRNGYRADSIIEIDSGEFYSIPENPEPCT